MVTATRAEAAHGKLKARSSPELDATKLISYTLDSLESGVITITRDGVITSFNSVAESLLGWSAEDAVGEHFSRIIAITGPSKQFGEMITAGLTRGKTFSSEEATVLNRSGGRITVGTTVSQLRDENDQSLGIVIIFKNLAEIKRVRDQFVRTEQMAALGYLSAGLAHELRNPLGSLLGLAELLEDELPPNDSKRTYTQTFLREIERMNKLVEDLLCFAQPPIATLERHSIAGLVDESLLFASYDFQNRRVNVRTRHSDDTPDVLVDPERLSRALLNIIRNAFQATPDGGDVTVTTSPRTVRGSDYVSISINNTGSYIEPEARQKLFTPFFTLKKKGTGLGLSIAHQIVKGHSGYIEVESDPAMGTTFVIDLPTAASLEQRNEELQYANRHAG